MPAPVIVAVSLALAFPVAAPRAVLPPFGPWPASFVVAGQVIDAATGAPLEDARVHTVTGAPSAATGSDGRFRLILDQTTVLVAEHEGYLPAERRVSEGDTALVFALAPLELSTAHRLEGLTITAVRAGSEAPVTRATLDSARLTRDYSGQDVPLTLRQAPSITAYSESGSLLNYSYFRLRGVDQSRINITLDGVPLNEPEDQQIYFSDFPDFTPSAASRCSGALGRAATDRRHTAGRCISRHPPSPARNA